MAGPFYPFRYAEIKSEQGNKCTLTYFLPELTPKIKVDASITDRQLTVQTVVNQKTYQNKAALPGDVVQGKIETKVKDGKVHVTFEKVKYFPMTKIPG